MAIQIQLRHDTTANWNDENPVLAEGELGYDTTTRQFKIGDGESTWSELEYFAGSGGGVVTPLPDFLTYVEGRNHLPVLNQNFGWNSNGVFFGPTADTEDEGTSYPIFTNFTIPQNSAVHVEFDMNANTGCNDTGMAIYVNGTVPVWNFGSDETRIAAQFNCPTPELNGLTVQASMDEGDSGLDGNGVYRFIFDYDPNAEGDKATFDLSFDGQVVSTLSIDEVLPDGAYRVGFSADNDGGRSYISNLVIVVDPNTEGEVVYEDTLTEGDSNAAPDLVLPLSILNSDGDDVITFEQSYTGTARIVAPQDDLALRSARDILLYAGDDGPGKVYIGWGDDSMDAGSNNEVATKGYVDDATGASAVKYVNWQYPTEGATAIQNAIDGESIAIKSSDSAAIRWHVRNARNGSVIPTAAVVTPGDGNFQVVFTIPEQDSVPPTGPYFYQISCPENSAYDTALYAQSATTTSITFYYDTDPGAFVSSGSSINFPSVYAQFEVDEDGAHIKIADWSAGQGSYSQNWDFTNEGAIHFPNGYSNARTGYGDVLRFATSQDQAIITGPATTEGTPTAGRLVVAGQDGYVGTNGEGGDIYLWAGEGGSADGNGGDIKIDGGDGNGTGQGGYTKIRGGYSPSGTGGFVNIEAGNSGTGYGGPIDIRAGSVSSGDNTDGGSINIISGSSNSSGKGGDIALTTQTGGAVILNGDGGEFLNNKTDANNQIATIGDIPSAPAETSFVVAGGTAGTQPTFDGDPLFSGTYIKNGALVHFQIQVLFSNITSFGTGQYYVDLPFPAKYGYQMRNGCIHDTSNGNQWAVTGHVVAGESRLNLSYSAGSGQDEIFDYNSPFVLQTVDKFHISGDYIALDTP